MPRREEIKNSFLNHRCYAVILDSVENGIFENSLGPMRPRVSKNDKIIAFERTKPEILFIGTTEVTDVSRLTERIQKIKVSPMEEFNYARKLSQLAGSLERVKNYLYPYKHFERRDIIAISPRDYNTIQLDRLDEKRTVFRYLFASLPISLKSDFVRLYPHILVNNRISNYELAAQAIIEYFEETINPILQRLSQIYVSVQQLETTGIRAQQLVLGSDEVRKDISFGISALLTHELIGRNELFSSKGRGELLGKCLEVMSQSEDKNNKWSKQWNDEIF